MDYVAETLERFAQEHFQSALNSDAASYVRPILVGPPPSALQALFNRLTAKGTQVWSVLCAGSMREVAVLLVRSASNTSSTVVRKPELSQECHWDYAVTLRNSHPLVLMLVEHNAWDTRHDSLQNTTETVGLLSMDREGRWLGEPLWRHVLQSVSTTRGLDVSDLRKALEAVTKGSNVDPATAQTIPWVIADSLLAPPPPGLCPMDVLLLGTGLPSSGGATVTIDDAADVINRLGKFFGEEGIRDGIAALKGTATAATNVLGPHLDALECHLNRVILSGASFARAPAWYLRSGPTPPLWWLALTVEQLRLLLKDLSVTPLGVSQIRLSCTNALNPTIRAPGEPLIVRGQVDLRADAATPLTPTFSRKLPRGPVTNLPALPANPYVCTDAAPQHTASFKYGVTAPGHREAVIDVIDVESFDCHGFVRVADAERNSPPVIRKGQTQWVQEIVLPRAGFTDFVVYHAATVSQVIVSKTGSAAVSQSTTAGGVSVLFVLDVDDNDDWDIALVDAAGASVGTWKVHCTVEEPEEEGASRFEVLVSAHQNDRRPGPPKTPATRIQQLENAYLNSGDSWKPVLMCWSSLKFNLMPDWAITNPVIGDISPATDPRPSFSPPQNVLSAREAVRNAFLLHKCAVSELELSDPSLRVLVEAYVSAYHQWLQSNAEEAVWSDCIAIYAAEWHEDVSACIASNEPVAMLLSPLHPLRLAWHVIAQTQLTASLTPDQRCPAAGLLDPTTCPDVGVWQLAQSGVGVENRAFFAVECDNVHWPILLSKAYVDREIPWNIVRQNLEALGLKVKGITGGITRPQAADSLQQIASLEPARAVLRVGIVGAKEGSQASTDGVMRWCANQFSDEGTGVVGPTAVEVYDLRDAEHPSPESLADLSDKTRERVRWYRTTSRSSSPQLDLSILDQLGTRSPAGQKGTTQSAVGDGALCRIRIREDFQQGQSLKVSRVGASGKPGVGLMAVLRAATALYESRAVNDEATHVSFQPLQQAIGARLKESIFVAISSSQIDPACMVRGAMGQGGYLWNFELPEALGGVDNRAGYYLVANQVEAMSEAIDRASRLITITPPNSQELLEEISSRGIPIMKRLVSGGSASRGELGMLLAVRLLQDVFRAGSPAVQLPVVNGECVHLIFPVDPYTRAFDRIRKKLAPSMSAQRGDFIVMAIRLPPAPARVQIKLTPVEVKFRETAMSSAAISAALKQAANLGQVMEKLWVAPASTDLWETCRRAFLAQCLDFAFRIYAREDIHGKTAAEWTSFHQRVIQDIIDGSAEVTVIAEGRLLTFDKSTTTETLDMDGNGRLDTAVICPGDAEVLLVGNGTLSPKAQSVARVLDFSFPMCGAIAGPSQSPVTGSTTDLTVAAVTSPPVDGAEDENARNAVGGSGDVPMQTREIESSMVSVTAGDDNESAEPELGEEEHAVTTAAVSGRTASLISEELRQRVRNAFNGFIGNEPAVGRISKDILRAYIEQPPHLSKNYLLTGQPSTGKTELARRMAVALALPFVKLDGRSLQNRDRLFEFIDGEIQQQGLTPSQVGQVAGLRVFEYPPLIVFIDEVHLVQRAVQESLLTMLEADDRTVTLSDQVARMSKTTFIFATTRATDMDMAFRTRCTEVQLREYTLEEVSDIVRRKFMHDWPIEVYQAIAKLGRCVPRVAIELARELETAITVAERSQTPLEHLDEVRASRELDELGLNPLDRQYLEILQLQDRPLGERPLLNMLGTVDKDRIVDEVEPFLKRQGFIQMGPQGREITAEGKNYVLQHRRHR